MTELISLGADFELSPIGILKYVLDSAFEFILKPLVSVFKKIVKGLAPSVLKLLQTLLDSDGLKDAVTAIVKALAQNLKAQASIMTGPVLEGLTDAVSVLASELSAKTPQIVAALNSFEPIATQILDTTGPYVSQVIPKMFKPLLDGFVEIMQESMSAIGLGSAKLHGYFEYHAGLEPSTEETGAPPAGMLAAATSVGSFAEGIQKAITTLVKIVYDTGSTIFGAVVGSAGDLGQIIADISNYLSTASYTMIKELAGKNYAIAKALDEFYTKHGSGIMSRLVTGAMDVVMTVMNFLKESKSISDLIIKLGAKGIATLLHLFNALLRVILNNGFAMVNGIITYMIKKTNSVLTGQILDKVMAGIDAMADVLIENARALSRAVMGVIQDMLTSSLKSLNMVRDDIINTIRLSVEGLLAVVSDSGDNLSVAISNITPMIARVRQAAINRISATVHSIAEKSSTIFSGFFNEISAISSSLMKSVSESSAFSFISDVGSYVNGNIVIVSTLVLVILILLAMKLFNFI